tara:strand:- start:1209 stop:1400 length:192 start_codon:yes stop_codon:yes gene_type:complete
MSSGDFIDRIEHIDGIFNVYVNHETINVLPKTPKQLDEMLRWAPIGGITKADQVKIKDALELK